MHFSADIEQNLMGSARLTEANPYGQPVPVLPAFLNRALEHRLRSYVTSRCQMLTCYVAMLRPIWICRLEACLRGRIQLGAAIRQTIQEISPRHRDQFA